MNQLNILCQGGHVHTHLRGGGKAAMSAKYPEGECKRIIADSTAPLDVTEGGSIPLPQLPSSFKTKSFEEKIAVLQKHAFDNGLRESWKKIVTPWLLTTSVPGPPFENETAESGIPFGNETVNGERTSETATDVPPPPPGLGGMCSHRPRQESGM